MIIYPHSSHAMKRKANKTKLGIFPSMENSIQHLTSNQKCFKWMNWFTKGKIQCHGFQEQSGVRLHFSALCPLACVGFVLRMASVKVTRWTLGYLHLCLHQEGRELHFCSHQKTQASQLTLHSRNQSLRQKNWYADWLRTQGNTLDMYPNPGESGVVRKGGEEE